MSGGHSKSSSKQQQTSQTQVWEAMAPYLQSLYGQGQELQGNQMQQAAGLGTMGTAAAESGQVGQGLANLSGMASGQNPIMGMMEQRASGQQNPYLQGNISALGENINQQLGIQMQGIGGRAGMAGQIGGGRQGVAEGLAVQGAQREFAQGANQMLGQDYQNQGAYAQQYLGMQQGALGGYMGAVGQQMNLGLGGLNAAWSPLMAQAGLMGPAVMESYAQGSGKSSSFAMQGGMG